MIDYNGVAWIRVESAYNGKIVRDGTEALPARITPKRVKVRLNIYDRATGRPIEGNTWMSGYRRKMLAYQLDGGERVEIR